jgi:hypothetical protein
VTILASNAEVVMRAALRRVRKDPLDIEFAIVVDTLLEMDWVIAKSEGEEHDAVWQVNVLVTAYSSCQGDALCNIR